MGSRIREAYEVGYSRGHNDTVESRVVSIALATEEYMETLLTAEPELYEDMETLVDDLCDPSSKLWEGETSDLDGRPDTYLGPEKVKRAIEAYASRRVQEARADERRRDVAGEVWDMLVDRLPKRGRTHLYDKMRKSFPIPAILQGTEPSQHIPDVVERIKAAVIEYYDRAAKSVTPWFSRSNLLAVIEAASIQGTEIAKVSEDMELQGLLVDIEAMKKRLAGLPIYDQTAKMIGDLFCRLVERLKEGTRG